MRSHVGRAAVAVMVVLHTILGVSLGILAMLAAIAVVLGLAALAGVAMKRR